MEVKFKKIWFKITFGFTCQSPRKGLGKMRNIETIVLKENIFECLTYYLIYVCWANLSNFLSITFQTWTHYFTNKFEFQSQGGFECIRFLSILFCIHNFKRYSGAVRISKNSKTFKSAMPLNNPCPKLELFYLTMYSPLLQ